MLSYHFCQAIEVSAVTLNFWTMHYMLGFSLCTHPLKMYECGQMHLQNELFGTHQLKLKTLFTSVVLWKK